MAGRLQRRGRRSVVLVVAALIATACSGGSGDDAADSTVAPAPVTTASDSTFTESDGDVVPAGDDPFAEEPTVDPDDFDLEIDDDVIIATEDGEIPPTSTEPPIENTPDAPPPPLEGPTTTVEPIAVPEPDAIGRVVSLSPTHTETLFALGLGEFIVAVDSESDFPEAAVALQTDAVSADSADVSRLLALEPDLVIIGDDPTGVAGRLSAEGIAIYSGPQADSLEEVFTQIEEIAALLGRPDLAEDLVASMRSDIDAIVASLPAGALDAGLTVFHEIDPTLFTVGSDSYLSDVYQTVGLTNIAGPGEIGQVTQMTSDEVIAADPDVILLADFDCCRVTIDSVAARPGWASISAIDAGAVVGLNDPLFMRWGPRVVDLLRAVAGGVAAAAG